MWSPRSFDEALTDKQAALADVITGEGTSIMAEQALGNEHFARELLDADASVVEKLLHRIEDVKETLARRKDAAAKEAFEEVRKAEQMFLDALAEKGMRFAPFAKIFSPLRIKQKLLPYSSALLSRYSERIPIFLSARSSLFSKTTV